MNSNRDYYIAKVPPVQKPGVQVVIVAPPGVVQSYYNEVTSVAAAVPTTVQTYVVPGTGVYLQKVDVSGTNIAEYSISIDASLVDKKRTYFGAALNTKFVFAETTNGLPLDPGAVVTLSVVHGRPVVGDFNSRIQILET